MIELKKLCPICKDTISGLHYGIKTCESCKSFFKRSVLFKKGYNCITGNGRCRITKKTRTRCRYCRYNKCLTKGMDTSRLQDYSEAMELLTVIPRYSWSKQGNAVIIIGEHRFKKRSKHMNQKQEMHWVCNKCDKGCKAKLTTLNDAVIKMYNVHEHSGVRRVKGDI